MYSIFSSSPSAANVALASVQAGLELADIKSISAKDREVVQAYNEDDCASTRFLRSWLEERRDSLVAKGQEVPRPEPEEDGPNEKLAERQEQVQALRECLTTDVPMDPDERTNEQQARWIKIVGD